MNNSQIAHLWAQQRGGSRTGSNFFFDDTLIFSYGRHFPIAKFISNGKGERAVLFTTRSYSQSTSRHVSLASRAVYGLRTIAGVFYTHDVTAAPVSRTFKEDYLLRVTQATERAARSRKYAESGIEAAQALAREANACAKFFGWKWTIAEPTLDPAFLADVRAKLAKEMKAKAVQTKRRAAQAARELAERIEKWRNGENVSLHGYHLYNGSDNPVMLRTIGDKIQTSRGADIPVDHAPRIWGVVRRVIERAEPYQANGHAEHAGAFRIDRIETDGTLRAGCHVIGFPELERIAKQLRLA